MPETQDGTNFERGGVRVSEVMGRVIFWRKMTQKMTQKTATVTSTPEVHLSDLQLLWMYPSRSCRLLNK